MGCNRAASIRRAQVSGNAAQLLSQPSPPQATRAISPPATSPLLLPALQDGLGRTQRIFHCYLGFLEVQGAALKAGYDKTVLMPNAPSSTTDAAITRALKFPAVLYPVLSRGPRNTLTISAACVHSQRQERRTHAFMYSSNRKRSCWQPRI